MEDGDTMLTPAGGASLQPRSHVQVNIYGTTVDALRRRGVDLERLISSLGCHCVVMDVPEIPCEAPDLVSVTSSQGSSSTVTNDVWVRDESNRSGRVPTANGVAMELPVSLDSNFSWFSSNCVLLLVNQQLLEGERHEPEAQSCTPIAELSPDSFIDLNIFSSLKPAAGASSVDCGAKPSSLPMTDQAANSFFENVRVKVEPCEPKVPCVQVGPPLQAEPPSGRSSRKRTPRLSFSPRESPEVMRKRKMRIMSNYRTTLKASAREYQCRIPGCGKILHFKQSCRRQGLDHVRSHFPKKTRRCKRCDYSGITNASVYNHHSSCHANEPYPGPLAAETTEDLQELQRLFNQAFPG
ncbi:hypothetical protein Y032_0259g498 [Ancylostoma ceylanicum]|nr:hypothetical protein Y032_0259g498 [Ancylostoma ceylanicum]